MRAGRTSAGSGGQQRGRRYLGTEQTRLKLKLFINIIKNQFSTNLRYPGEFSVLHLSPSNPRGAPGSLGSPGSSSSPAGPASVLTSGIGSGTTEPVGAAKREAPLAATLASVSQSGPYHASQKLLHSAASAFWSKTAFGRLPPCARHCCHARHGIGSAGG